MRIYSLTSVGDSVASSPTHNPSTAQAVLYWLRKHGGQATDDQIRTFALPEGADYSQTINSLLRSKAIRVVG